MLLVGVLYLAAGIVFGALAGRAASNQMRVTWRLAAWVISAAAFATHIGYEQLRLRSSPRTTALHVSLAAALGAFGLAVAANIHSLTAAGPQQQGHALTLSLVIWPVLTGLPAFLVALTVAVGLSLVWRADRTGRS